MGPCTSPQHCSVHVAVSCAGHAPRALPRLRIPLGCCWQGAGTSASRPGTSFRGQLVGSESSIRLQAEGAPHVLAPLAEGLSYTSPRCSAGDQSAVSGRCVCMALC